MKTPCVSLTFDDGWESQYSNARPILNRFNIKATFYIISQYIYTPHDLYMNVSQMKRLIIEGHEIGAHTVTHPELYKSIHSKGFEVQQSRYDLQRLGIEVDSFAYPYGLSNSFVQAVVNSAGFTTARLAGGFEFNSFPIDPLTINGIFIKSDTTIEEVSSWIDVAIYSGLWLVFVFHQVDDNGYEYGCSPFFLEKICQLLIIRKINLDRLTDAFLLNK